MIHCSLVVCEASLPLRATMARLNVPRKRPNRGTASQHHIFEGVTPMNDLSSRLLELFIGFFRANIVGYGGGPATIPLIEAEAVSKYEWLTKEEFADTLAMG